MMMVIKKYRIMTATSSGRDKLIADYDEEKEAIKALVNLKELAKRLSSHKKFYIAYYYDIS